MAKAKTVSPPCNTRVSQLCPGLVHPGERSSPKFLGTAQRPPLNTGTSTQPQAHCTRAAMARLSCFP